MKFRTWLCRTFLFLFVAGATVVPASAQNFPFPIPSSRSGSVGIGDIISIVGSVGGNRSNAPVINDRRNADRAAVVIGIAGALYEMSRQGRQPSFPETFPGSTTGSFPGQGGSWPESFPAPSSSGQPDGYSYIENQGQPIRLDPRILPLTINAGGGQGDQVVGRAIENWNNAGIGQVFALTSGPADLTVDWSGSKVSRGARAETRMVRSRDYVVPTDLSVRTEGRTLEQLARIMTHELGHVLGLDHSRERNDVMYASEQNGSASLTRRDVAMATWLYGQTRYSPVIGRTDLPGGMPSVATHWASHRLDGGTVFASSCGLHDHD